MIKITLCLIHTVPFSISRNDNYSMQCLAHINKCTFVSHLRGVSKSKSNKTSQTQLITFRPHSRDTKTNSCTGIKLKSHNTVHMILASFYAVTALRSLKLFITNIFCRLSSHFFIWEIYYIDPFNKYWMLSNIHPMRFNSFQFDFGIIFNYVCSFNTPEAINEIKKKSKGKLKRIDVIRWNFRNLDLLKGSLRPPYGYMGSQHADCS